MKKFAFYGRVSTEDNQDPQSSRGWQLQRSLALIEPHGGVIVAEYFDVGQSRSLPWKRRDDAPRLLADIKDPNRGFEAVVIGEPARAFYGNQFGDTFPVFTHYGVELWVPEVGGRVDPDSDAHDLVMNLYGGMSKGERNRIKIRVRTAMQAQAATEGRFLGGRPPYGYMLGDAGPHPNPSKAATGQRLRRLERDPVAAPIVERIFTEYVAGAGIGAIAEGLNREGVPSPSGHDPARNRHRAGANGAWGKSAVRAILQNPRYTGRQVWNRQRREEELLDVEDPAAGYKTKMTWNKPSDWVQSAEQTHEAIVPIELFDEAQRQRSVSVHRKAVVKPRRRHTYALSSLIYCGTCNRRMSGAWNHGQAHYRCGFKAEYAGATGKHAKWVYLRESEITPRLDEWMLEHYDPKNLDATIAAHMAAQGPDGAVLARQEAAHRTQADCERRLAKYRQALDAGADAAVVADWMREVEGLRIAADRELRETATTAPLDEAEIRALVQLAHDGVIGLDGATAEQRATIYASMVNRLTYDVDRALIVVEARLTACTQVRVGGGT